MTNSQLVKHIEFRNNQCPVCLKEFKKTPHVHRHYVEIHMGHADFQCSKCSRKFKRRYLMEHHQKRCSGTWIHQCHSCNTVYKTKQRLIEHMTEKHNLCLVDGDAYASTEKKVESLEN